MRCLILIAIFAIVISMVYTQALDDDDEAQQQAIMLTDIDGQGHENEGLREARAYGRGFGRGFGGYGGYGRGFGGYGGYGRGFGGYRGGYGYRG